MPYGVPYTNLHNLNLDWFLQEFQNLKNYIEHFTVEGVVRYNEAQELTSEEQARARDNIDAASVEALQAESAARIAMIRELSELVDTLSRGLRELGEVAVQVDHEQNFSVIQKNMARFNIDAASVDQINSLTALFSELRTLVDTLRTQLTDLDGSAVQVDGPQSFSPAQQAQARANIGVDVAGTAVLYSQPQDLSDGEQGQARTNIGAVNLATVNNQINTALEPINNSISELEDNTVQVDFPQIFSFAQKEQGRANINAAEAVPVLNATRGNNGVITWDRPDVTPELIAELKPRVILHTGDNIVDMDVAFHSDGSFYRMTNVMAMDAKLDVRRLLELNGVWTYQSFHINYTA